MLSQSNECEYFKVCSAITDYFELDDLTLLMCSFMRVLNCLFVWPTYEASQSLQTLIKLFKLLRVRYPLTNLELSIVAAIDSDIVLT